MKRTLAFSMLAAVLMTGFLFTLPAEADTSCRNFEQSRNSYRCRPAQKKIHKRSNRRLHRNRNQKRYFSLYKKAPIVQRLRTERVY